MKDEVLESYYQGRVKRIRSEIIKIQCKHPYSNNETHVAIYNALEEVKKLIDNN